MATMRKVKRYRVTRTGLNSKGTPRTVLHTDDLRRAEATAKKGYSRQLYEWTDAGYALVAIYTRSGGAS